MEMDRDAFMDMAERIADSFHEIDNDIMMDMIAQEGEYAELRQELARLQTDYPLIEKTLEGGGGITLTAEEHRIFVWNMELIGQKEDLERRQIYFRGHTDCFAYLKKIGAI